MAGIWLDLTPQAVDHILKQDTVTFTEVPPHPLNQVIGLQNPALMAHQQVQQAGFQVGQLNHISAGDHDSLAVRIQQKAPHLQHIQGSAWHHQRSPQPGLDLGHEQARADRVRPWRRSPGD